MVRSFSKITILLFTLENSKTTLDTGSESTNGIKTIPNTQGIGIKTEKKVSVFRNGLTWIGPKLRNKLAFMTMTNDHILGWLGG